ncbi:MAG: SRPBCC family protein [Candidatus Marinimicrobia bacterium]|jgi:hypothetical protein|nr:SRPBCC family protein [Candidatus Neomarinimicrobiota bacterium]MBT3634489.1 SRPBCC family protein [Candidatus Neomarinimicrobiota bacterium]MBT3683386.1 SRPBCC family protein [Candidatus Neomarinimicrobiota bacterium]MBT3760274.1 SRPBCC family protein [Candidatus Neomarinimicrobiota bacterium]MBT3896369.1 SRPBCC family protein [Candidatus Neomarinimicrobiota bacterium]
MKEFKSKTAHILIPVSINAPVDKVFPLVSPIEEYKWIPGWKCNLIYCPDDTVGLGTIFSEISSAPFLIGNYNGKTTWTAVEYDPENYKIHFRLDNKKSSSLYKIELRGNDRGMTEGKLDFTYTAINKKGNQLIVNNVEEKIHIMLSVLYALLKNYSESNEMLLSFELRKMIPLEKILTIKDKILVLLNRLAKSKMVDKDRKRFMDKFSGK